MIGCVRYGVLFLCFVNAAFGQERGPNPNPELSNGTIYNIVFLCLGIIVFAIALVFVKLSEKREVDFGIKRLGLLFKGDIVPFLFLLGAFFVGVSGFFHYQDYETKFRDLREKSMKNADQLQTVRAELAGFKSYEMEINLVFPSAVDMSTLTVQPIIKKIGQPRRVENADPMSTEHKNVVSVRLSRLNPGDQIFFVATEGNGKTWKSTDTIEVPVARLEMVAE